MSRVAKSCIESLIFSVWLKKNFAETWNPTSFCKMLFSSFTFKVTLLVRFLLFCPAGLCCTHLFWSCTWQTYSKKQKGKEKENALPNCSYLYSYLFRAHYLFSLNNVLMPGHIIGKYERGKWSPLSFLHLLLLSHSTSMCSSCSSLVMCSPASSSLAH